MIRDTFLVMNSRRLMRSRQGTIDQHRESYLFIMLIGVGTTFFGFVNAYVPNVAPISSVQYDQKGYIALGIFGILCVCANFVHVNARLIMSLSIFGMFVSMIITMNCTFSSTICKNQNFTIIFEQHLCFLILK